LPSLLLSLFNYKRERSKEKVTPAKRSSLLGKISIHGNPLTWCIALFVTVLKVFTDVVLIDKRF